MVAVTILCTDFNRTRGMETVRVATGRHMCSRVRNPLTAFYILNGFAWFYLPTFAELQVFIYFQYKLTSGLHSPLGLV